MVKSTHAARASMPLSILLALSGAALIGAGQSASAGGWELQQFSAQDGSERRTGDCAYNGVDAAPNGDLSAIAFRRKGGAAAGSLVELIDAQAWTADGATTAVATRPGRIAPLAQVAAPPPRTPPYDPTVGQSMRAQCNAECFGGADKCLADPQAAPKPGVCDTRAIACLASCPKCVQAYVDCRTDPTHPGEAVACMTRELACAAQDRKAAAARTDWITFSGGEGASLESAVVIDGARNEEEGVLAERYWVARRHPGWRSLRQALLPQDDRRYDLMEFAAPDGSAQTLYFDITGFFGKM